MQIVVEKQDLKNAVGAYLQENPQLIQLWLKEWTEKLLPPLTTQVISDDKLSIEQLKSKYAVKRTALKKMQKLWHDQPSAEQIIIQISK